MFVSLQHICIMGLPVISLPVGWSGVGWSSRVSKICLVSGCVGYAVKLCMGESSDGWLVA